MAFERNDIVNKTRLAGELGEELMGFEHNDIVTVDVMNKAIEEGGGGGGGETITWLLKDATATVAYDSEKEDYGAKFLLPASVTADNFESTFSGKSSVIELNGDKVESPIKYDSEGTPPAATIYYWEVRYGEISSVQTTSSELYLFFYSDNDHTGQTFTLSLGIVEE